MHHEEWSGSRVAAALARLAEAGYPQARLARMAGVDRSAVNRWSRGENRPGHDAVRRLAAAVFRDQPDIARELVEASGYAWAEPAEASQPAPATPDGLLAAIYDELPPDRARRVAELVEAELAGEPLPAPRPSRERPPRAG